MKASFSILALMLLLGGCATAPTPAPATIETVIGRYGMPAFVLDGETYELSIDERRAVIQGLVDTYCPTAPQ